MSLCPFQIGWKEKDFQQARQLEQQERLRSEIPPAVP